MADKDDKTRFGDSFVKARAKNKFEESFLRKQLMKIDKEYRNRISSLEHGIYEERQFASRLRQESDNQIKTNSANMETTTRRHFGVSKSGSSARDVFVGKDDQMSISGQRILSASDVKPSLIFWSQDASTKLPVMTSFYGYRFSFQRSMTEIKLLGQQTYPESRREIQSADPASTRDAQKTRMIHTSGGLPRLVDEDRKETRDGNDKPPPTRGRISLNYIKNATGAKLYDKKPDNGKTTPEGINLNLKQSSVENLPQPLPASLNTGHSTDPRKARRRLTLLHFKTREEATKCNRDMLSSKNVQKSAKSTVVTELDRSYSNIPVLMSEVTRLNKDVENDKAVGGKQFTKTAYGTNMQQSVSKKVLNNCALPVAFRKNHSTYLKHYGTPLMEEKTPRNYNTPDSLHTPVNFMTLDILNAHS